MVKEKFINNQSVYTSFVFIDIYFSQPGNLFIRMNFPLGLLLNLTKWKSMFMGKEKGVFPSCAKSPQW